MDWSNPGIGNRIPIFGGCVKPGVYKVLVKPKSGTFRDANGQAPHILYEFSGAGQVAEFQYTNSLSVLTDADKIFTVEFDAGGFSINTSGSLYLTGGGVGQCVVELERQFGVFPMLEWHWLTTQVANGSSVVIPDYHTKICGWTIGAGVTLEGVAIDVPPYPVPCVSGGTLSNLRGATIMIATGWWG